MKFILFLLLTINAGNVLSQEFQGKRVDVYFGYPMINVNYCSFFEYKLDDESDLADQYLSILQEQYEAAGFFNVEDSNKPFLTIKSMLTFVWKTQQVAYIRYDEIHATSKVNKVFISKELLEMNVDIEEILNLTNEAFWQFYNSQDDPDYPVINQLKTKVKDAEGTVNLNKLAAVIKNNRTALSDYFLD